MGGDPVKLIEEFFEQHGEDMEFSRNDCTVPCMVRGPGSGSNRIIFGTKGSVLFRGEETSAAIEALGLVVVCGLPMPSDANWIRDFAAGREIMFLGDMDPTDLLIFTWLRASLHPLGVTHLGVSDQYLDALGVRIPENFRIELGPAEKASLQLLRSALPDIDEIVGEECAGILDQGYKIEIEAVVGSVDCSIAPFSAILEPALR